MFKFILTFFLLGLSFGVGPCLVSCGPFLAAYVCGTGKNVGKSFFTYLVFALSRIAAYVFLSLSIFFIGQQLFMYDPPALRYLNLAGGILIILLGIFLLLGKDLNSRLCHRIKAVFLERDKKTVISLGFIWGVLPCAPLISVLSYIGLVSKNWVDSLVYTLGFGLGTTLSPLLAIIVLVGLVPRITQKNYRIERVFHAFCAIVMIYLGWQLTRKGF